MIRDMVLGFAGGDAVTVGVEFKSRPWILENIDFSKYVNARDESHSIGYRVGDYSDDTEMMIGTMKAMISSCNLSSGTPMTATSMMDGCVARTSSISRGYTFSPPRQIMSFVRSR